MDVGLDAGVGDAVQALAGRAGLGRQVGLLDARRAWGSGGMESVERVGRVGVGWGCRAGDCFGSHAQRSGQVSSVAPTVDRHLQTPSQASSPFSTASWSCRVRPMRRRWP